jgi:hypothetical protein
MLASNVRLSPDDERTAQTFAFSTFPQAQANKPLYGQPIVAGAAWEAVAAEFSSEIDRGAPPI